MTDDQRNGDGPDDGQLELDLDAVGRDSIGAFMAPEHGAPETQRGAAIEVYPRTGTTRRRVLDAIGGAGRDGFTDEEVSLEDSIRYHTVTARRNELLNAGWIEDSGRRRLTTAACPAAVWVLSEAGRRCWRPQEAV